MSSVKTDDEVSEYMVRLRGSARLRFDALMWHLWNATGRSRPLEANETIRALVLFPSMFIGVAPELRLYQCRSSGRVYGSPWCWAHGEEHCAPHDEVRAVEERVGRPLTTDERRVLVTLGFIAKE